MPMSKLPPLNITDADREDSNALAIPDDLHPDDPENISAWWIKIMRWMGAARASRERELTTLLNMEHQHTTCCVCTVDKPTPVRCDDLGGYICAGCLEDAYFKQKRRAEIAESALFTVREELKKMVKARWMVSVDWAPHDEYDAICKSAQEALDATKGGTE